MGDYIHTEAFEWCTPKEPHKTKRRKRKRNFNVTWFTLGWIAGMLATAAMYNLHMIMS